MKTYRLDFDNVPIIYVFDEDGTISYTPTSHDALAKFFASGLQTLREIQIRRFLPHNYATLGSKLLILVYTIAICKDSEELLQYLKALRDAFGQGRLRLFCSNGILEKYYNTPNRITKSEAFSNLRQIYNHGI